MFFSGRRLWAAASQFTFTIEYKSDTTYDYTGTACWSTSNNSVTSVSGGSASPAGVGSVIFEAFADDVPDYSDDCYSANPDIDLPRLLEDFTFFCFTPSDFALQDVAEVEG